MSTSFPTNIDNLNNPAGSDTLAGHAALHGNVNDAIEALEAKVGVDGSNDPDSLDYKVSQVESQLTNIGNQTGVALELLGLEGNNDLTVTGIENKTAIDSFAANTYRTVKYTLQITRGTSYHSSEYMVLNDQVDINISESNIISNTNSNLASVTFESNAGIISLCVTPITSAVTARFIRTAIKA